MLAIASSPYLRSPSFGREGDATAISVAGHFPLTLVTGAGAAARNSIGLVLVGGMAVGTLFTLFVIPSIYMLVARDHTRDLERQVKI